MGHRHVMYHPQRERVRLLVLLLLWMVPLTANGSTPVVKVRKWWLLINDRYILKKHVLITWQSLLHASSRGDHTWAASPYRNKLLRRIFTEKYLYHVNSLHQLRRLCLSSSSMLSSIPLRLPEFLRETAALSLQRTTVLQVFVEIETYHWIT